MEDEKTVPQPERQPAEPPVERRPAPPGADPSVPGHLDFSVTPKTGELGIEGT